jgi:signal transduction histidine kinase
LSVTTPDRPVWLNADPTRVVQMISNLLTNAAKYMRDGGSIQITSEVYEPFAVVRVKDEGIGIEPGVLARVFDPYVQGGVGPLHAHGLGIGLALVKAIAEGHGGSVQAHSEGLDCGSEFIIRLPMSSDQCSRLAGDPGRPDGGP